MRPEIIVVSLIRILAVFLAAFFFWRKLRQDYPNEEILTLTTLIVIFGLLGGWKFFVQGAFLGVFLIIILFSKFKKWNPWLTADAAVLPLLFFGSFFLLTDLILGFDFFKLSLVLLICLVAWLNFRLEKKYRSIAWYKSGKVGFLACFSIFAFFSLFFLLEIFLNKVLYWQLFGDLCFVVLAVAGLYLRSEREFKKDLQNLVRKIKNEQN